MDLLTTALIVIVRNLMKLRAIVRLEMSKFSKYFNRKWRTGECLCFCYFGYFLVFYDFYLFLTIFSSKFDGFLYVSVSCDWWGQNLCEFFFDS